MLKFHPLTVTDIRPDAQDAIALSLDVPPELRAEYCGRPGQHVVVRARSAGEQDCRRTYSLINSPGEWPLRIVVRIHRNGMMSRHLAETVRVGEQIEVLPPNGSLTPRAAGHPSRTYVAFASGCGITPVLSVTRSLLRDGHRMTLFYGNTTTERAMCAEELLGLKDRYVDRLALHFIMSREPQEAALYNGRIDAPKVRELAGSLFRCAQVAEYFVCGPGDMIEQVSATLRQLDVESARIHSEHFTTVEGPVSTVKGAAPTVEGAAAPAPVPIQLSADSAEVTVLMDGRRRAFTMRMHSETVLDAATRAGLDLPFSCRAGVCSTCRTKVVTGAVEMEQNYALEDWELEQGYILACQARVKTPSLALDYDAK
ncbi:MAG TPA: 2Fe-2S iron-sulfur cluster-binding protein [Steroidobacteraceae bacterium]